MEVLADVVCGPSTLCAAPGVEGNGAGALWATPGVDVGADRLGTSSEVEDVTFVALTDADEIGGVAAGALWPANPALVVWFWSGVGEAPGVVELLVMNAVVAPGADRPGAVCPGPDCSVSEGTAVVAF
jgi:hypothetical protein